MHREKPSATPEAGRGGDAGVTGKVRLSANPAEPGYPCYVSVLGELAWMPSRGELLQVYPTSSRRRAAPG